MNTDRSSVTNPRPPRARLNSGAFVISPLKRTSPAIVGSSPGERQQGGGLPGTVRADERHDLAGFDP